MKDNGIEDILIGERYDSTKRKGKKSFVIVFILLLIILALMLGVYKYALNKQKASNKELFLSNLINTDVKNFLDNSIYTELLNRVLTENSESTSSINFTSNLENKSQEKIDLSKFVLELSTQNDVTNSKAYGELGVNYSGNEVFRIKLLSDMIGARHTFR